MAEERKIRNLPDGWQVTSVEVDDADLRGSAAAVTAILQRVPKPKQLVLLAEVGITAEETKVIRISTVKILWSPMETRVVDSWRIEERDA